MSTETPRVRFRCRWLTAAVVGMLLELAAGPAVRGQEAVGEIVDVRTGFVRVTAPRDTDPPTAADFTVTWNGTAQPVREVVGGPGSPIEVGIVIDRSPSMHESLEAMKAAAGAFLDTELSADDAVFVVGISDTIELLAEGREAARAAIANLASDLRPGVRPTRLFAGLERALEQFGNAYPRALLLVASDGCDSVQEPRAARQVLTRAADLAIPIVLVAPSRADCRNRTCVPTPTGGWECTDGATPGTVRVGRRGGLDPTQGIAELPATSLASPATRTRDLFVGRLAAGGGAFLVARSAADWTRRVGEVRELLARQWTVVFEPGAAGVRSSEVRVTSARRGGRRPERESTAARDPAQPVTDPVATSVAAATTTQVPPGETGAPTFEAELGVEVVSVDVVASGRRGRRVLDLAASEFTLAVDGEARPIDYFAAPRGPTTPTATQDESEQMVAMPSGGTSFLVVDRATLDARAMTQVLDALRELVHADPSAGRRFAVASFAEAATVHEPGSAQPQAIERALDAVGRAGAQGGLRRLERRQLEGEIRAANRQNVGAILRQVEAYEEREVARQAAFAAAVRDLVATGADPDAANLLVIATEGFAAEPGRDLRELLRSVAGDEVAVMLAGRSAAGRADLAALTELDELAKALQELRVTAYTLVPSAGFDGVDASAGPENRTSAGSIGAAPRRGARLGAVASDAAAQLAGLADATGGASLLIADDLDERLAAIGRDAEAGYSLGFRTGPHDGFERHAIRVETSRPGVALRHRASFRRRSPADERQAALAAAARTGIVRAALPIALRLEPIGSGTTGTTGTPGATSAASGLVGVLDIPLGALQFQATPDGSDYRAELIVQLAVTDAAGALTLGPEEAVEIAVPEADWAGARQARWTHRVALQLPSGRVGVGALVLEPGTGTWATAAATGSVH